MANNTNTAPNKNNNPFTANTNAATAAATATVAGAARTAETVANSFVDTCGDMLNGFFAAQKKMVDTFMPANMMKADGTMGIQNPAFAAMKNTSAKFFHTSIDAAGSQMGEIADIVSEQAHFAGRIAERSMDTLCCVNGAKSPEAFVATGRSIMTDCVENMSQLSQEMVKMSACQMESMQNWMTGMTNAFTTAFTGACKATDCCQK